MPSSKQPNLLLARSLLSLAPLFSAGVLHARQTGAGVAPPVAQQAKLEQKGWKLAVPTELFAVTKVVDGDTIYIERDHKEEKLRLLSVDTEEKFSTNTGDASKPSTTFGEECAQWAMAFFKDLGHDGAPAKVGLLFPGGVEERDVYGRLLCYLVLPDGRNFNLLLVQLGKSPYFNKYGNSRVCHEAMVAAQAEARAQKLGIWSPEANLPKTAGAPSAKRPYDELLPWWDARAAAVDAYRAKVAADPAHVAAAETPAELERVLAASQKGENVMIFGSVDRVFDEKSGDQTVLLRSGVKEKAVRVVMPAALRAKFAGLELEHSHDEFKQNYFWVQGKIVAGARGFEMRCEDPQSWSLAGPQPKLPETAGAR